MRHAFALLLFLPCVVSAQVVSPAPDDVAVVIYREDGDSPEQYDASGGNPLRFGLAMVSEHRTVQLPAGRSIVRFQSVADAIVPQTAKLEGLPRPVVESNFDYDLLGPGSMIANSIGQPVRIVRTNRQSGLVTEQRATLRSGPQGVMLESDGRLEALGCSGLDERFVFENIPASLAERPTLSMNVDVPQAGRYKLRLSYLTLGLSWTANYVAQVNRDGRTLDLVGWITLTNHSASSFSNAPVKVIAGTLARDRGETVPPEPTVRTQSSQCWPVGNFASHAPVRRVVPAPVAMMMNEQLMMRAKGAEDSALPVSIVAKASDLGDYKLYTLPEPTTVAANQTKQVKMMEKSRVAYERFYRFKFNAYQAFDRAIAPMAFMRLQNRANSGLGLPMPAGKISVMEPNAQGQLIFAGEDRIEDVPVGLPAEMKLSGAMDLWVRPRLLTDESLNGLTRREVEMTVGNDKSVPVTLELVLDTFGRANQRIASESRPHSMKAGNPVWTLTLAPGARQLLRYTVEVAN